MNSEALLCVIIILIIFLLFRKNYTCKRVVPISSPYRDGFNIVRRTVEEPNDPDYADTIKKMGLESSVETSHARFVKELDSKSSTASKQTTMDSFNPPVPWHGLPRKAMFARLGADSGARTVQTETADQTLDYARHNSGGYSL